MTPNTNNKRPPVVFERTLDAPLQDVWALWTTKEGFEAWWGPEGFRVEVHAIEPHAGGRLSYDMIAVDEAIIAHMKSTGMPSSHATVGTFAEVTPMKRLKLQHIIDFIPGVEAYENNMLVEFTEQSGRVRMVIKVDPHFNDEWTGNATAGMNSQLNKLPGALATVAKRRHASG